MGIIEQAAPASEMAEKDKPTEYVHVGNGLFPRPIMPGQNSEHLEQMFLFLGQFVAKAVMDGRLVDLPLNPVMWKALLMRELCISDVSVLDKQLGATLQKLHQVGVAHEAAQQLPDAQEKDAVVETILVDGARVEDLCLDFTFPGRPDIELVHGGAERPVVLENIGEYVQLVTQMLLHDGIVLQVEAFRRGFIEILPLDGFLNFTEDEIETLVCGDSKFWDCASFIEQI